MALDKDIFAGLCIGLLGVAGLYLGADYAFGTPARMGAGFLPRILCWSMVAIGALITLIGIMRRGDAMDAWDWDPLFWILLAVLAFGVSIERLGLALATAISVIISRLAGEKGSRLESTLVVVCIAALLVFMALATPTGAKLAASLLPPVLLSNAAMAIAGLSFVGAVGLRMPRLGVSGLIEAVVLATALGVGSVLIFVKALGLAMKMWPGG